MSTPDPATTDWVPLWDLDGGVDLVYRGDYAAGSYSDGDVVVYNGVAYMCVTPTSTSPAAWPGGPTPAPFATPPYGTSLPTSPINGQEAILVDSVTNPSYQWRFRYNANSSSAYKWECIGSTPMQSYLGNQEYRAAGGWGDLQTVGPRIQIARAGEYEIYGYVGITKGPNANYFSGNIAIYLETQATIMGLTGTFAGMGNTSGSTVLQEVIAMAHPTPVLAGEYVKLVYSSNLYTNDFVYSGRRLMIRPVRVS